MVRGEGGFDSFLLDVWVNFLENRLLKYLRANANRAYHSQNSVFAPALTFCLLCSCIQVPQKFPCEPRGVRKPQVKNLCSTLGSFAKNANSGVHFNGRKHNNNFLRKISNANYSSYRIGTNNKLIGEGSNTCAFSGLFQYTFKAITTQTLPEK